MSNKYLKRPWLSIILGAAFLLTSCISGQSQATPSAVGTDAGTSSPAATSTPVLHYEIQSVTLLPGQAANLWRVVGLFRNDSDFQVEQVLLSVSLIDDQGQNITSVEIETAKYYLDIDEESPFAVQFELDTVPTAVEVNLLSYEPSDFVRPDIEVQVEDTIPLRTGGSSALGRILNRDFLPIYLSAVPVVVFNADGEIIDFAMDTTFMSALGPRTNSPLGVVFPSDISFDTQITAYPDAIQEDRRTENRFEFGPPTSIHTAQGKLIVIGEFQNVDWQHHRWLQAVLVAQLDGETLAVAPVIPPSPIAPGETRAYAIDDLPGLHERLARLQAGVEELSFDILLDLGHSGQIQGTVTPLTLEIEAFEAIGSSIFIRGSLSNPSTHVVLNPAILASLRSTEGMLRTAGWMVVADELEEGASLPFTLALDIPSGENVMMLEFDVVASGVSQ